MVRTYSQQIANAQVMLSGVKTNQKTLERRGIDEKFVADLGKTIDDCLKLNNEQEELKARLKTKTNELNKQMAEMKAKTNEARKIVKMDMPQTTWKEFGILDKR